MTSIATLHGPRVQLRAWRDSDLDAFAALNADPEVMEFLPAALDRAQTAAMMARMQARLAEAGWGHWCLDVDGAAARASSA